jgi:hypothetical protein
VPIIWYGLHLCTLLLGCNGACFPNPTMCCIQTVQGLWSSTRSYAEIKSPQEREAETPVDGKYVTEVAGEGHQRCRY